MIWAKFYKILKNFTCFFYILGSAQNCQFENLAALKNLLLKVCISYCQSLLDLNKTVNVVSKTVNVVNKTINVVNNTVNVMNKTLNVVIRL